MRTPDFSAALTSIRPDVPWLHHGRDPQIGLDCFGLVFAIYGAAGMPINHLDMAYGERDHLRPKRTRLILSRVMQAFRMMGKGDGLTAWPVVAPRDCMDGDLLLLGSPGKENHMGIAIGGQIVQMAGRVDASHNVVDGRIRRVSLHRSWAFVTSVFRHNTLCPDHCRMPHRDTIQRTP
jgi:cell wall-associated NlpC family hydrolase